jgi:hypothetical protein
MKSALHNKILSRGYWQTIIRPASFKEKRIDDIAALFPIIEKAQVRLRGWYFPHIDSSLPYTIDMDWIGQEFEWNHYKTLWRFYQSGLFFHVTGVPLDWRDESTLWPSDERWKPNVLLGIGDTIATFTEIFEFAARLALSEAGDNNLHIEILVGNLQHRFLYVDSSNRWPIGQPYQATIAKFPYETELPRSKLVSESKNLALHASSELFKRFRLDFASETLRSWQDELKT